MVHYHVALAGAGGPYTVEAALMYQTIGYRWMEKLRPDNSPESQEFFSYIQPNSNAPVQISSQQINIP